MQNRFLPILTLSLLFLPVSLFAQKQISGMVADAETGEPLVFANIQIEGTYRGTSSNDRGEYSLKINELPVTLLVRYIGYDSQKITITKDSASRLDFVLKPRAIPMQAVVVTGEDPAVFIMREVIKRKQIWRKKLKTFRADAYSRNIVENDTSIAFMLENTSQAFWDSEQGFREIVKSRRKTENIRFEFAAAANSRFANFYNDNIPVMGHKVPGPTNPDAFDFYKFELVGQRALDDKVVFDISVTPKSKLQPAFSGKIAVLDEDYALISISLQTTEGMVNTFPIRESHLNFDQQFSNFGHDFWLPVDAQVRGFIKLGMPGLLSFPRFNFSGITRVTDYAVNVALPDSLYKTKEIVSFDSLALKQDSLLVADTEIVPLNEREQAAYEKIDSTYTFTKAFEPKGPLARFVDFEEDFDEGKNKGFSFDWSPEVGFNRVEAGNFGLNTTLEASHLTFKAMAAYKTGLEKFGFGGSLNLDLIGKSRLQLSYSENTARTFDSPHYSPFANSLKALAGRDDYFDYYWNKEARLEFGLRSKALWHTRFDSAVRLEFLAALQNEKHSSLQKQTDFDIFGRSRLQRPNPAIEEGTLRSFEVSVALGEPTEEPLGLLGRQRFEVTIEHSSPDFLDSDFSFTRYRAMLDWRFETFLKRRFLPNVLDVRVSASTSSGDLPIQRFGALESRLGAVSSFGVLKTLKLPVSGRKHLSLAWEHNFRTVPFEILGWGALVRNNISLVVHGAHGKVWDFQTAVQESATDYGFHHEVGLSVNGIWGVLRLDATKRLDDSGFFLGLGFARMF